MHAPRVHVWQGRQGPLWALTPSFSSSYNKSMRISSILTHLDSHVSAIMPGGRRKPSSNPLGDGKLARRQVSPKAAANGTTELPAPESKSIKLKFGDRYVSFFG